MDGKKVCNCHDLCSVEKQYLLPLIDIDEENPFLNSKKILVKKYFHILVICEILNKMNKIVIYKDKLLLIPNDENKNTPSIFLIIG